MRTRAGSAVVVGTGLLGLSLIAGCDKGPPPGLQDKAIVGTWLEVVSQTVDPNPRVQPVPRLSNDIRKLTMNADKTFTLVLCTPDGKPIDDTKRATGTWAVEEGMIKFTVTSNTLPEPLREWAPSRAEGVVNVGQGEAARLGVFHSNEERAEYKPAG